MFVGCVLHEFCIEFRAYWRLESCIVSFAVAVSQELWLRGGTVVVERVVLLHFSEASAMAFTSAEQFLHHVQDCHMRLQFPGNYGVVFIVNASCRRLGMTSGCSASSGKKNP